MPPIFVFMEVANTFMPTASTVGLLPMITYFFLIVAMLAFLGNFIFIMTSYTMLSTDPIVPPYHRMPSLLMISTTVVGFIYYIIQTYYYDVLTELATVSDINDRQTLIRESYNAIGQYRYIEWFITMPLLLLHGLSVCRIQLSTIKRPLAALLLSTLFMVFASYIGHQQLSFDNEIQVGPKLIWGLIATIDYVFILFTLNRLWKESGDLTPLSSQPNFRFTALPILTIWGIYLLGYFLTIFAIDFNWIHIVFTVADLVSIVGISLVAYVTSTFNYPENPNLSKS